MKDEIHCETTKAQRDIAEVEEIWSEMNLTNDYANNGWDVELKELEEEISQWKSQLQAVIVLFLRRGIVNNQFRCFRLQDKFIMTRNDAS